MTDTAPDHDTMLTAAHVDATHRLAMSAIACPALKRAEATARLELAAAILAFDDVEDRIEAGENIHSVNEQLAVERTQRNYAQALANLLRRDED